ncbi:FAD/NAD(P)-binding domain-containing protein, partial [Lepidopterella palustris CBS 459.81]
ACDVPIYLYEMSWAKRTNWTELLPLQPEIQSYLDDITHQYGLYRHIQFATQLVEARWLEDEKMWALKMRNSSPTAPEDAFFTVKHHVVVMACGPLSQPRMPEGIDASVFQGEQFHSQQWQHDTVFEGKNVAVVGNGCSATQFMPIISRRCKSVTQYVSSPHWLVPRNNPLYTEWQKWIFQNIPGAATLHRYQIAWLFEKEGYKLRGGSGPAKVRQQVEGYLKAHLEAHAPKKYVKQLTPNFPVGCKRLVLDSNYLDCLHADNIDLAFTRVSEVTESGLVGKDGSRRDYDIIIWATGFLATMPFNGIKLYGRDGQELHDRWEEEGGPRAYAGVATKGFPNLYMTTGPNTFSGHTSITQIIEKQAMWIAQTLKLQLDNKVQTFEITPQAEKQWSDFLRERMSGMVWTSSACNSWFKTKDGFIPTNFPGSTMLVSRTNLYEILDKGQFCFPHSCIRS